MNQEQAAKWAKIRTIGKAKYVMYYGVAAWGIGLTLLFTGIEWVTQGTLTGKWLTIRLLVFGVIGFMLSAFRWESNERRYQGDRE
ncbi:MULTISPECIES: hypothetical protein [Paenibacillus]|uniref:hypothetical protein n=1 Tax=Paenibacillus TaxID=44249 RepID=UPI0022B8D465|nr:hypothetical protein [Paenibacillus caseinilyticus]MCZ8518120.1 hypothetical protein [Paenibacillus caseinilyticus]